MVTLPPTPRLSKSIDLLCMKESEFRRKYENSLKKKKGVSPKVLNVQEKSSQQGQFAPVGGTS